MKLQTRNFLFNYLTIIMVYIFIFFFLRHFLKPEKPLNIFSYAGFILLIPSIIMFTIARIQLGGSFQVSAEANKLVKTGVYKKVRHPIYVSGILFLLGLIFITQMYFLLIIWAVIIVIQLKRIQQEEKVLTGKFGDEYSEYKKQTWI